MIIECTYGPVTTEVMGVTYNFVADEHGRFVAEVWNPKHLQSFLNVTAHYRRVSRDPDNPTPDDVPVLDSLDPDNAVIGGEDIVLRCLGSNFAVDSVIVFNGGAEPTSFISETEVTTIVKPSTASVPGDYTVVIQTGDAISESVDFAFTSPARSGEEAPVAEEELVEDEELDELEDEEPVEESDQPRSQSALIPLTEISGIGPAMESKLREAGITDARQIAELTDKQAAELDDEIGLGGRIAREKWVEQAKALAT
jgi:predicted flap endonuclease-1-like 5' DNA nuclease